MDLHRVGPCGILPSSNIFRRTVRRNGSETGPSGKIVQLDDRETDFSNLHSLLAAVHETYFTKAEVEQMTKLERNRTGTTDGELLERELTEQLEALKSERLSLDLTRGKPGWDQIDLSNEIDGILEGDYMASDGTDVRNYGGGLRGIPEIRAIGTQLLNLDASQIIAGGNSSLQLMHLSIDTAMHYGLAGNPLKQLDSVTAICPVPGYDRHYTLTESFGIRMVNVPICDSGPNMNEVERLVQTDDSCCFIWCVPKYSNPTGCIYSPEVVERIASLPNLKPQSALNPFYVLWDNAYEMHDFGTPAKLESLYEHAISQGTEDRMVIFGSTSKITFAGAGVGFVGGSDAILESLEKRLSVMTVGPDKVNQLRTARFLQRGLSQHMEHHAEVIRPKFEAVQRGLDRDLGNTNLAQWTNPQGGYFVSLDTKPNLARKVVARAATAGLILTPAGATYPYGKDSNDCNIRIAPTLVSVEEIEKAIAILTICVKLETVKQKLSDASSKCHKQVD